MNADDSLALYGLWPAPESLKKIRVLLGEETRKERRSQGEGDTDLMKSFCVQLFNAGHAEDALLVWSAKSASMDSYASIDLALVCVSGLEGARRFLADHGSAQAQRAHELLSQCIGDEEFDASGLDATTNFYARYYGAGD